MRSTTSVPFLWWMPKADRWGVVSETDLVLKTEAALAAPAGIGARARRQRSKAAATTAQGLMTATTHQH